MLPFLEELLYVTTRNYLDNSNVGWVGINWFGRVLTEEEYAVYPDSNSEEDTYDTENAMYNDEHEDCYCHLCERPLYEPPITRIHNLYKRNQETILDITNKIIESYKERSYYMYEYMEEQKHYTKEELDKIFDDSLHSIYVTEQEYRDICDSIKIGYDQETKNLISFNDISCIQLLMADNAMTDFITACRDKYKESIEKLTHLRKITLKIQK